MLKKHQYLVSENRYNVITQNIAILRSIIFFPPPLCNALYNLTQSYVVDRNHILDKIKVMVQFIVQLCRGWLCACRVWIQLTDLFRDLPWALKCCWVSAHPPHLHKTAANCRRLQTDLIRVYCVWKITSLCLPPRPPPVAPPQPPAEDVDRYRRRFNMRMLVPGRPVKETPAAPPPVPTERPTYREKFIPPELSMWDYFVAKVRHWILHIQQIRLMIHSLHINCFFSIASSSLSALPAAIGQQCSVWLRRKRCGGWWRWRWRFPFWHTNDGALWAQLLQVGLPPFGIPSTEFRAHASDFNLDAYLSLLYVAGL